MLRMPGSVEETAGWLSDARPANWTAGSWGQELEVHGREEAWAVGQALTILEGTPASSPPGSAAPLPLTASLTA